YINGSRTEQKGGAVLQNIRELFANTKHNLIEIGWLNHDDFVAYIKEHIDIGLQVSFTETFNLVAADFVQSDIPIIVSEEVKFIDDNFKVNMTSVDDIVNKIKFVYYSKYYNNQYLNFIKLQEFMTTVKTAWKNFMKGK
ncbi:MAG: hypothetical protein ABSG25_13820, partial [Bryobacteraceae bacterium]